MKGLLLAHLVPSAALMGYAIWLLWKPLAVALGLIITLCLVFWFLGRRSK